MKAHSIGIVTSTLGLLLGSILAYDLNGRCGPPYYTCPQFNPCCSKFGYCGSTPEHCARDNCMANCWPTNNPPPGYGKTPAGLEKNGEEPLVVHDQWMTQSAIGINRKQKNFPEEALGVYFRCIDPGVVALTYDDGPSTYTPELLNILDAEGVKATFFVLAKNLDPKYSRLWSQHRKTLRDAVLKGHIIGSHSYSHPNFVWNPGMVEQEMQAADKLFTNVLGFRPRLMRPPEGAVDENIAKKLQSMGYFVVNWSHDTNDWKHNDYDPTRPIRYIKSRVPIKSTNPLEAESVLLLQHDTYDGTIKSQTAIIKNLKAKGYRFVTVAECIGLEKPYRK